MKEKTDKELHDFCREHYYVDLDAKIGGKEQGLWEPFQYHNEKEIEELIQNDITALKLFIYGEERDYCIHRWINSDGMYYEEERQFANVHRVIEHMKRYEGTLRLKMVTKSEYTEILESEIKK